MFGGCDKPGAGRMAVCNGRVALCNRRTDGGRVRGKEVRGLKQSILGHPPRFKHSSGYPQLPCPPTPFFRTNSFFQPLTPYPLPLPKKIISKKMFHTADDDEALS